MTRRVHRRLLISLRIHGMVRTFTTLRGVGEGNANLRCLDMELGAYGTNPASAWQQGAAGAGGRGWQ